MTRLAALIFIGLALDMPMSAQELKKNEVVLLKVPSALFSAKSRTSGWGKQYTEFTASVESAGDRTAVNGDAAWQSEGFPSLITLTVDKISPQKDAGVTEVRLKGRDLAVKFLLKGDAPALFKSVVAAQDQGPAYQEEARSILAERFFTGPLASIPDDTKEMLLSLAERAGSRTRLGRSKYKENLYLAVELGVDDSVYNELKMNQAQRVARVINEKLLGMLRRFSSPLVEVEGIYGIKLEFGIPHRDFLRESEIEIDRLELFAPLQLIRQLVEAEISSQQLIDGSVLLVDDNRIEVSLAAG